MPSEPVKGPRVGTLAWPKMVSQSALAVLGMTFALSTWGFIQAWVLNYAKGQYGNNYAAVWINGFTWVLCIQAVFLMCRGQLAATKRRFWAWIWFGTWMLCCALIILIGLGIALTGQFAWTFLWLPPICVILAAAVSYHNQDKLVQASTALDVEVGEKQPRPATCSAAAWKKAGSNFLKFCGWSSMFWLSVLGFFLALQAAWLASDKNKYPPPGILYAIPIDGVPGTSKLHLYCKGPTTPGLATFIMEGGAGSPGISYDPIVNALAAAGRRACWYDRLGYGWSDDSILPTTDTRTPKALKSLLEAANEAGPFIIAGHSAGGQLAQQFAGLFPSITSGLVLLDSYNDAAIALEYMGAKNVTVTRPDGSTVTRPDLAADGNAALGATDAVRALTPLTWPRLITNKPDDGTYWTGAMNAAYGNNKEWHAQFVELYSGVKGYVQPLADQLTDLAGGVPIWQGVGWPSLGNKPVLLLPAAATLVLPPGCERDFGTNASCQAEILSRGKAFYPKLYLAYKDTLSSNTTLTVLKGGHAVWEVPDLVATYMLQKFAGI